MNFTKYFILFTMFFVFLIALILGIIFPIYKSHYKATNKIINYDSVMRKFVFKVYKSKDEIIYALKVKNNNDELTCTLDLEKSIIVFSEYGSKIDYYFDIKEFKDFSILRLTQVSVIGMQSHIPYKINPFLVNKIDAEIIPFSQYEF